MCQSKHETSPLVYQSQVYIGVHSHTQRIALQSLVTCRLVSALSVGHQQAIYKNTKMYAETLCIVRLEIPLFYIKLCF